MSKKKQFIEIFKPFIFSAKEKLITDPSLESELVTKLFNMYSNIYDSLDRRNTSLINNLNMEYCECKGYIEGAAAAVKSIKEFESERINIEIKEHLDSVMKKMSNKKEEENK